MRRILILIFLSLSVILNGQRTIQSSQINYVQKAVITEGGGGSSSLLTGLLAYYDLDEASGTVLDAHSTNVDLSIAGGVTQNTASGKFNTCYRFNGTTGYVGNVDNLKPTTGITVSFWIKTVASASTSDMSPISNYYWAGNGWDMQGYWRGGCIQWTIRNPTATPTEAEIQGDDPINDGNWHSVIGTFDGTTSRLYIDGVEDGTAVTWANNIAYHADNRFMIGAFSNGVDNPILFWNRDLDAVGIWSRAITSDERTVLQSNTYPFE